MIIEGGSRCNSEFFEKHLEDTTRINEEAKPVYSEGVPLGTAKEMFDYFRAMAAGSNVKNFFTHMAFNNKGDWPLTAAEEIQAYKIAAKREGLQDQPFFLVRHKEKNGDQHFHAITLRVGADGKAVNKDYQDQLRMAESSREIEKTLGLRRMEDVAPRSPEAKQTQKWERYKGAETGYTVKRVAGDLKAIKGRLAENTGAAFLAALESKRYVLARGDKTPFLVVDRAGGTHYLGARLGLSRPPLEKFMGGVDAAALPSVKEARASQRKAQKEESKDVIKQVWSAHSDPQKFIDVLKDIGFLVATGDKRGVFIAVDKNGYYVSLERSVGAGREAFAERMKSVGIDALPTLDAAIKIRRAEKEKWSEKHKGDWKKACQVARRINGKLKHRGGKSNGKFGTRNIVASEIGFCRNPMPYLRSGNDGNKSGRQQSDILHSTKGMDDRPQWGSFDRGVRQARAKAGFKRASPTFTLRDVTSLIWQDYAARIAAAEAEGKFEIIPGLMRERDDKIKAAQEKEKLEQRGARKAQKKAQEALDTPPTVT